jgi:uncharacterized protein involved in exopolysaccharide biosynthesis
MTTSLDNTRASKPQEAAETEISLFDIVRVLFRYKRLITVFTGAATLLSVIYALMQPINRMK